MTVTEAAAEASVATSVFDIPEYRLDAFNKVVDRANRKAAKLGVAPFVVSVGAPVAMSHVVSTVGDLRTMQVLPTDEAAALLAQAEKHAQLNVRVSAVNVFAVTVEGVAPQVAGWEFGASIDHDPAGNVVTQVPGSSVVQVSDWVSAAADCGHCNLRRNRMKTYVLRESATGAFKQVGSTCIEDFLGGSTAAQMAALADLWQVIDLAAGTDSDHEYGAGGIEGWTRVDVIAQAAAVVREVGFLGKGAASEQGRPEQATAVAVLDALTWRPSKQEPVRPFPTVAADWDKAEAVIDFVDALSPKPSDDYLWNLQSAVARPVTVTKQLGLVVSAVSAYDREMGFQARKAAEALIADVPVPVTDERMAIEGTVLSTRLQEGDFGTVKKMLVQVFLGEGAYKLWGNAPSAIWEVEAGDTVKFVARVKRSDKDESFGFWSRPTKAEIVAKGVAA